MGVIVSLKLLAELCGLTVVNNKRGWGGARGCPIKLCLFLFIEHVKIKCVFDYYFVMSNWLMK